MVTWGSPKLICQAMNYALGLDHQIIGDVQDRDHDSCSKIISRKEKEKVSQERWTWKTDLVRGMFLFRLQSESFELAKIQSASNIDERTRHAELTYVI
jgi:hypothetical protein